MLFLFFHCDHTLSSWDYFIATGVLFSLSWLHRQTRLYFEHGIGHRAKISMTTNGFICVRVPTESTWTIGQHFFVRFMGLGVHAATNHPFTACSLPSRVSTSGKTTSELVFYIRAGGGTTARLAHYAETHPNSSMRVLLDGPYGGIDMQKILQCRQQLVIAGGSGAGWVLPLLSAFVLRQTSSQASTHEALRLKIVVATRDVETRDWFESAVRDLVADNDLEKIPDGLEIELYYTGSRQISATTERRERLSEEIKVPTTSEHSILHGSDTDASSASMKSVFARHLDHRPDLSAIVEGEVARMTSFMQLGVFVCGPLSMQNDVANAVAVEQLAILKGASKDVYLHMEHFAWA